MISIIDSNIWIYYFDQASQQNKSVAEYLNTMLRKDQAAVTSVISVEVVHYLFRRLGTAEGYEKAKIFHMGPIKTLEFTSLDLPAHLEKMRQTAHLGIGGRDATILVCMEREGIDTIVTHDKSFQYVESLKVVDPVSLE